MVGIAICTTVNAYKSFEDNDIILNICLSKGMSPLTRNQRLECALFLQMIKDRKRDTKSTQKKKNNKPATLIISTRITSTETEFRKIYLRGMYTILPSLPQPEVQ